MVIVNEYVRTSVAVIVIFDIKNDMSFVAIKCHGEEGKIAELEEYRGP